MKFAGIIALMLNLGITGAYAQNVPVKMSFSGNGGASAIDLKYPGSHTGEENVAGNGTFGQFTFRNVSANSLAPGQSTTCMGVYFPRLAGGGVIRFQDGSLLTVSLSQGGDCIDFVHMLGHCVLTLQVTGGTGRFLNATGTLTYDETALPVIADFTQFPVLFSERGEITGTISGIGGAGDQAQSGH
jgi:hypothetical protein